VIFVSTLLAFLNFGLPISYSARRLTLAFGIDFILLTTLMLVFAPKFYGIITRRLAPPGRAAGDSVDMTGISQVGPKGGVRVKFALLRFFPLFCHFFRFPFLIIQVIISFKPNTSHTQASIDRILNLSSGEQMSVKDAVLMANSPRQIASRKFLSAVQLRDKSTLISFLASVVDKWRSRNSPLLLPLDPPEGGGDLEIIDNHTTGFNNNIIDASVAADNQSCWQSISPPSPPPPPPPLPPLFDSLHPLAQSGALPQQPQELETDEGVHLSL
jgi:hypothetical protein